MLWDGDVRLCVRGQGVNSLSCFLLCFLRVGVEVKKLWLETGPPHLPPRHICVMWYWGGGEVKHQLPSPIILPLVDSENSGVGTLLLVMWSSGV